jgi:hypothetical protein
MYYISHLFGSRKAFIVLFMLSLLAYGGAVMFLSPHITHAAGTTYYVATNGSDSNSCTQATNINTPKWHIEGTSGGLSCLTAGDMLDIRGGTYQEVVNTNNFTMPYGTSWANAVTIQGHAGETVIIRGTETIALAVSPVSQTIQYVIWSNLVVEGSNGSVHDDCVELWGGANHMSVTKICGTL